MRQSCAIGLGPPTIFGLIALPVTSNSAGSIAGKRETDTWITLISTPVVPLVAAGFGALIIPARGPDDNSGN